MGCVDRCAGVSATVGGKRVEGAAADGRSCASDSPVSLPAEVGGDRSGFVRISESDSGQHAFDPFFVLVEGSLCVRRMLGFPSIAVG